MNIRIAYPCKIHNKDTNKQSGKKSCGNSVTIEKSTGFN